jgi:tetratricopeptide (TPR) repeat protein
MTFFELERECKKRKIKRIFYFVIFILISAFVVFLIVMKLINKPKLHRENKIVNKKEINQTKVVHKQKIKKEQKINKVKEVKKVKKDKNITSKPQKLLKPIIYLDIQDSEKIIKNNKKKKEINISKSILNVSTLPSFETSIKLAQEYFKEGDYKNALKWAKNANIQNKKDPRSWIIVAKSLYKLGEKDKAIKVLQIYFDYTRDKKILKIIERIKNGKI